MKIVDNVVISLVDYTDLLLKEARLKMLEDANKSSKEYSLSNIRSIFGLEKEPDNEQA